MFVKSNILRSPHAFATRRGGVSVQEHTKSLNLAFGRGDEDEIVLKNLDIFAQEVGFERESIVSLPQIHSDRIFTVTKEMCGQGYFIRDGIESSDGYVTAERGVTLGIKTADCTPILIEAEKDSEIIAIGAVHAGWRGTRRLARYGCRYCGKMRGEACFGARRRQKKYPRGDRSLHT
jgi:copper oxidase (laccase) domain-containing protein